MPLPVLDTNAKARGGCWSRQTGARIPSKCENGISRTSQRPAMHLPVLDRCWSRRSPSKCNNGVSRTPVWCRRGAETARFPSRCSLAVERSLSSGCAGSPEHGAHGTNPFWWRPGHVGRSKSKIRARANVGWSVWGSKSKSPLERHQSSRADPVLVIP